MTMVFTAASAGGRRIYWRIMRKNKYNARKTEINGITFDSKKEAERYLVLLSRHQAGEITMLKVHPKFELMPGFRDSKGKAHRAINYFADFEYITDDLVHTVEDVKGMLTDVFRLKHKLFLRAYPHIDFRIVK